MRTTDKTRQLPKLARDLNSLSKYLNHIGLTEAGTLVGMASLSVRDQVGMGKKSNRGRPGKRVRLRRVVV